MWFQASIESERGLRMGTALKQAEAENGAAAHSVKSLSLATPGQTVSLDRPATSGRARRGTRLHIGILRALARGLDAMLVGTIALMGLFLAGTPLLSATVSELAPYLALIIAALGSLSIVGAWRLGELRRGAGRLVRAVNGTGVGLILTCLTIMWLFPGVDSRPMISTALALWCAVIFAHSTYGAVFSMLDRSGRLRENVVIVGATPNAEQLIARNVETRELNIRGVFDDRLSRSPGDLSGVPVLGDLDDLINWIELPDIDRIIVTVAPDARERVRALIDRLRVLPHRVVLLLDLQGFDPETESIAHVARSPAAYVSGRPHDVRRAMMKRGSDVAFALAMIVFFAPVFALTALAIKLEDGGPIFFRQRRHGFNNQIIKVWKFRSMKPDPVSEHRMVAQTFAGDTRVTRVGKFIRATSIDELPQLWNVVRGEMSIVGPRPHAVGMTTEQTEVQSIVSDYAHRHRVKPGITGWAQVNGSRGPVHTKAEVEERVRLDLEYVNRSSFWLDLYIMAITAPCLLGDRLKAR